MQGTADQKEKATWDALGATKGTCGLLPRRILTRFPKQGNWLSTLFWGFFFYSYSNILTKISCEPTSFAFRELNYISFEQYFCSEYRVLRNSSSSPDPFYQSSHFIISVSSLKKKLSTKQTHHETVCGLQAFKKLLRDWHPDKNADRVQVCTAVFQFLQKARHLFKSERRWLDWPENDLSSDLVTLVICC